MFTRTESFKEFLRFYPVVSIIVFIHIVLYLFTILPVFPSGWLFENFAGVNLYIVEGELWRLITPIFLHSGFPHMLFNSFSLVLFGPGLERLLGKRKFITLYLATGILANIATLILKPLTYSHVGSSGAIFGLFGIYLAMRMFRKDMLSRENSQVIITIAVIGLIMTFIQPNINVTAHLFGLISGFLLGGFSLGRGRAMIGSFKSVTHKASSQRPSISPKMIILGGIVLLAILGLFTR
ncbi:rhomboid family intramembrane serine protease [Bacillus sp. 31A1R]|uniref:Rhomboid family intramembrane serine protease n=1 Tax=Robertmurraya mangrovi TaxID=3098077 RepID=A0ABU5J584_9BACI|nr:rhomboid family intramembrane serine protease [Bacillus sp. 31A1R]MDZ5474585.1 rhomboid family intramembrane serine protease [Bacillus sp. 31A1R]